MVRQLLILALAVTPLAGQFSFERVEVRTGYGEAREGDKGRLQFTPSEIRFLADDGAELFTIPAKSAVQLLYSPLEGRRSGTLLSKPFDMLGGTKHFLTISFKKESMVGAVELKLHKSNYQSILRNTELLTGLQVEQDEPEQAAQPEVTSAPAAAGPPARAILEIVSTPQGAEVEINHAFNGLTPRRKSVEAGDYRIVIRKPGFETFERLVSVEPGQTLEVSGDLRELRATAR